MQTKISKYLGTLTSAVFMLGIFICLSSGAYAQSPEGTWHGERTGVKFYQSGPNLAYDKPAPTVHPKLTEHSQKMVPGVYQVADRVYLAYGYALTSPAMIVGDDGVIIVDPPEDVNKGRLTLKELRKYSDKPVKAVIYSHWHIDHFGGVAAFASHEDAASGKVKIIAHKTFLENVIKSSAGGDGPIIAARVNYAAGTLLDVGPKGRINAGLGPDFVIENPSLIPPNVLVDEELDITVAGVKMHIVWIPSEAPDEIAVWFPKLEVIHTVEIIQGEAYPNVHTIRGTRYRDPELWFKGVDRLREFPAKYMVPSHGRPVSGYKQVAETLTAYRDGIQYVYDQTLRYMNKGMVPDELVEVVKLPAHLAEHPWLGDFYGGVPHTVRQIFVGELGWFLGDPTFLAPIHFSESSKRYVEMMGGRNNVLKAAQKAARAGDHQWAAELTTHLVNIDKGDREARLIKAEALRQIGYGLTNNNWRNWYITSAQELDGTIDYSNRLNIVAPDLLRAFPTSELVNGMRFRLKAEDTLDVRMTFGIRLPDINEGFGLEIRRGVAQFHESLPDNADVVLEMNRSVLENILLGQGTTDNQGIDPPHPNTPQAGLIAAFQSGDARLLRGTLEDFQKFFSYFEPLSNEPISVSVR
jgi:alkyl sulfatase BDS1-like metallo-beta-lactamase superfamily hydrolase